MSFDWIEYLNLAGELTEHPYPFPTPSTEAKKRSAISRAYFAAHHIAREYIEREQPDTDIGPGALVHGDVWRWFKTRDDLRLREVGENLNRLNTDRGKADYEATVPRLDDLAYKAVVIAQEVINSLPAPRS